MLNRIEKILKIRESKGKLRSLAKSFVSPQEPFKTYIDFSSNDYLGLARNLDLYKQSHESYGDFIDIASQSTKSKTKWHHEPLLGSSGSRLLTGDNAYYHDTENYLANFHNYKHSMLANSGWDLNFGLCSCLSSEDTVVLYDEYCHNSIISGIRQGRQRQATKFHHNDMNHLRQLLGQLPSDNKERIIYVESLYSMDGDICPLLELLDVASQYDAQVIVDEAHSTGVYGRHGEGLIGSFNLQSHPNLLGTVHTFGKAVGVHGAAFLTNHFSLISYMYNYNYPLIYSTSLPLHTLISIRHAYELMSTSHQQRSDLFKYINYFKTECLKNNIKNVLLSDSPIQGIIVPGNERVVAVAKAIKGYGFNISPIRAPTVTEGMERLRIVLHAHNSEQEIAELCRHIASLNV